MKQFKRKLGNFAIVVSDRIFEFSIPFLLIGMVKFKSLGANAGWPLHGYHQRYFVAHRCWATVIRFSMTKLTSVN